MFSASNPLYVLILIQELEEILSKRKKNRRAVGDKTDIEEKTTLHCQWHCCFLYCAMYYCTDQHLKLLIFSMLQ